MKWLVNGYEWYFLIAVVFLGMCSGFFSRTTDFMWYATLSRPVFTPPNWIFGPVWTVLYVLIGIAFAKMWHLRAVYPVAFLVFCVHLVLNFLWSPLFFRFHRIDLALYDLSGMLATLILCMTLIRQEVVIIVLCLPYLCWISFAFLLNYALYSMNG